MQLVPLTAAFVVGVIFGVGACVLYFNYKVNQQIGMLEEQMEDIDDMMGMQMEEPEEED